MSRESVSPYVLSLRGPIIVTGASGFVGANLARLIGSHRQDVFAVVRRERGWRLEGFPDDQVIAADLNDFTSTRNLLDTINPQTVFHCAAYGAYSFEVDATLIYNTNFISLVNLVELLASRNIAAFIHAGSSSEYGTNCAAPNEDDSCIPNSPYAVSKVAAANYLTYMGKQRGFPAVNLRLYSVYGPLEDTSRLIPNLFRAAMRGELPPFVEAGTSRDFVYVDDVCEAFVLSAAQMHPGLYGEQFNVGSGVRTTIGELAALSKSVFNLPAEPVFESMPGRVWDLPDWYSDPSKARDLLNWSAKTDLKDGLLVTYEWVASLTEESMRESTKKGKIERGRSLSAIVACYKDGDAIPLMYQRLTQTFQELDVDYEIIFVNDGSPDESAEIIRTLSEVDGHVLGISHSRNFGSQMAFRSGMELATKDGVVLLDGDLQDPPELVAEFYALWDEGFDVVFGRRVKREMPWHRGLMYKAFYRMFARLSYVNIPLDAGDFSLMDRKVVRWLLSSPERDLFIRGLRAYVGFKQTGVDYVRPERMFGRSTNSFVKNVDWAKRAIFSFSSAPMTAVTNIGIVSLFGSLFSALVLAFLRLSVPEIAPRGATTLLVATLIFGSMNLFAIGLVGEYVSKILTEVKRRPRLIRAALIRHGHVTELLPDGKVHDDRKEV